MTIGIDITTSDWQAIVEVGTVEETANKAPAFEFGTKAEVRVEKVWEKFKVQVGQGSVGLTDIAFQEQRAEALAKAIGIAKWLAAQADPLAELRIAAKQPIVFLTRNIGSQVAESQEGEGK